MKSESKLNDAIFYINRAEFETKEIVLRYLREFLTDNATTPAGKKDIFSFTEKGKEAREIFTGIYYDPEGYAVATNSHILIASKDDYKPEHAGKIINKYGEEIAGRFPKWRTVFPMETGNESIYNLDVTEIQNAIKASKAAAKAEGYKKQNIYIKLGNTFFTADLLLKFAVYSQQIKVQAPDRNAFKYTENYSLILSPCSPNVEDYNKSYESENLTAFYFGL